MQYMLLIHGTSPADGSAEAQSEHEGYFKVTQEMVEAGAMQSGAPLQGTDTATTVRVRNGQVVTTDGPFAETKEQLLGFYLLDCKDLDGAIEWAAKLPTATHGSIEVRPVRILPGM